MLFILIIWVYIAFLTCILGGIAWHFTQMLIPVKAQQADAPMLCVLGLSILSICLQLLSFWFALGATVHLVVLSSVLLLGGCLWKWWFPGVKTYFRSFGILEAVMCILFVLAALLQSLPISYGTDEKSYYIQTLLWMEQYPVIPGLGNLAPYYAYNSSWHACCAFFRFSYLGFSNLFNDLNGFLFVLLGMHLIRGIQPLFQGKFDAIVLFKAGLFACLYFYMRGAVATVSVDMALALIIPWIFLVWVESILMNAPMKVYAFVLPMACFAFTCKVSALVILLLPLGYGIWYLKRSAWRKAGLVIICCISFCGPFLAKNVLTTGYLLHPVAFPDIFSVDWKMPVRTPQFQLITPDYLMSPFLTGKSHQAERLARVQKNNPEIIAQNIPLWTYFRNAFSEWSVYAKALVLVLPIVALLHVVLWLKGVSWLKNTQRTGELRAWLFMVYAGVFVWALLLPSWKSGGLRIGLGFLLVLISTLSPILFFGLFSKKRALSARLLYGLLFLLIAKQVYNVEHTYTLITRHYVFPPKYPEVATHVQKLKGIPFYIVVQEDAQDLRHCWGSPVPCHTMFPSWIELRGTTLEEGFRWKSNE